MSLYKNKETEKSFKSCMHFLRVTLLRFSIIQRSGFPKLVCFISFCCGKRDPFPGPQTGHLSDTQKWNVRGDTCADKQETLLGRAPGGEQEGQGTQENCSVWLPVPGFMGTGSVSRWPLADHSNQSLSWWRAHRSAKMDASERDSGKWTDARCLPLTFPELLRVF